MPITPEDLQLMARHWLMTPPNGYLGSGYGSPVRELLQAPLSGTLADELIQKLKTDVAVFGSLPGDALEIYAVNDGLDKLTLNLDVVGARIPLELVPAIPDATTLTETSIPPKVPTLAAFNRSASGLYVSGPAVPAFSNADRTFDLAVNSLTNLDVIAHRPRKAGKYYFEYKAEKIGGYNFRCTSIVGFRFRTSGGHLWVAASGYNEIVFQYGPQGLIQRHDAAGGSVTFGELPRLGINHFGSPEVANNATVRIAVDTAARKAWIGYEGDWIGNGNPATGTAPLVTIPLNWDMSYGFVPIVKASGSSGESMRATIALATSHLKYAAPVGFIPFGDPDYLENDA
jgi:hypothetical protein